MWNAISERRDQLGSDIKLTPDEANALRVALSSLAIRNRTGELGVLHGMDRFVSTNRTLSKTERNSLDQACRKIGLMRGIEITNK